MSFFFLYVMYCNSSLYVKISLSVRHLIVTYYLQIEDRDDHRSYIHNLSSCEIKA